MVNIFKFSKLFFIIIHLVCVFKCYSQTFEYTYSTLDDELVGDAVEGDNGDLFLVGQVGTYSNFPNGSYSGLIIKLNTLGDTIKTLKKQSIGYSIIFNSIVKTSDTILIVTGNIYDPTQQDAQIIILKIDTALNVLKETIMGDSNRNEIVSTTKLGRYNELLLIGFASSPFDYQVVFYKTTLDGDSLSSYYTGDSTNIELGFDVLDNPDPNVYFLFTYNWVSPVVMPTHNEIVKINSSGVIDTIVFIPNSRTVVTARWISDTTFIISNTSYRPTGPFFDYDLHISKYDTSFNLLADTLLGAIDTNEAESRSLDFIDNNKIFLAGTTNYQNTYFMPDPAFFFLTNLDNNLNPQWQKFIARNDDYLNLYKVLAIKDGGALLIGSSYNDLTSGINERDIYAIKLDSLGNFVTNTTSNIKPLVSDVLIFPIPANNVISIKSAVLFNPTSIIIYDSCGKIAVKQKIKTVDTININTLAHGLYLYQVLNDRGEIRQGKLIVKK